MYSLKVNFNKFGNLKSHIPSVQELDLLYLNEIERLHV